MAEYSATISWERNGESFVDSRYSRAHRWQFDGGQTVPASSSPHIVPLPHSVAEHVDPEEAFVASLSSCHMLFFLSIAAERGYVVDRYRDAAVGYLGKDANGRFVMSKVILRPEAEYAGEKRPAREDVEDMHHRSHELCFIANSVRTEIVTDIVA